MPDDSSDYDNALLARLNALKASNVSFGSKNISSTETSSGVSPALNIGLDRLVDRSRDLAGVGEPHLHSGPRSEQDEDDGKTVEDLLAEIGPDDQWTQNPEEPNEMHKLLIEARLALSQLEEPSLSTYQERSPQSFTNSKPVAQMPSPGAPPLTSEADPEASPAQTEDEEAAIYLQQILDELQIEEHDDTINDPSHDDEDSVSGYSSPQNLPTVGQAPPGLDMPSVPSSIPLDSHESMEDESMPALDLPSAPTTAPQRSLTTSSANARMPQYSDQDIEAWCVICNDDATVRCLGCDGDLYCAKCWKEGHMGKEAGYDERTHRWVKYKRR
ncbi:hypothetical protein MMC26_004340 [Xylographa opegraphella]|nr:hypothetical protein [Xylographa opegraphella]